MRGPFEALLLDGNNMANICLPASVLMFSTAARMSEVETSGCTVDRRGVRFFVDRIDSPRPRNRSSSFCSSGENRINPFSNVTPVSEAATTDPI